MTDLAAFLSRSGVGEPTPVLGLVAGMVVTWSAGANTISVYGNTVIDASYLSGLSFVNGDMVAMLKLKTDYLVIGKIVTP